MTIAGVDRLSDHIFDFLYDYKLQQRALELGMAPNLPENARIWASLEIAAVRSNAARETSRRLATFNNKPK